MNERIQELAYEAEDYADGIVDQGGEFHPAYTEKLAELIVKECILTIQMGITRDGTKTEKFIRSMTHIKDIKEHFGVEE